MPRIKERFIRVQAQQIDGTGTNMLAGISIMTSGSTVVSVSCAGVNSGDAVIPNAYMFGNTLTDVASGNKVFLGQLAVTSVRANAFEITAMGSRAPAADCPIAWIVIRR